jgi:predicted nucleotidyltransferase
MSQTNKDHIVQTVLKSLQEQLPDLEALYLYGSQAMDMANSESDWDFGFLHRPALDPVRLWNLKTDLEARLNLKLDLVELYSSSTVHQIEVLRNGILIWTNNPFQTATFEYLALSFYQKLNEERAGILKDIEEKGNIYG